MAVREILLLGNPALRVKCDGVKNFHDRELQQTVEDLRDTLADFRASHGFGRGIAAPQIGAARRVIFLNVPDPHPLINPEIVSRSRQMMTLWDDCFSFPDLVVKLKRHAKITVRYQDESGTKRKLEAAGDLSELLQHEIDHLNGVLAIDRAVDTTHIILRSEWEKMKLAAGKSVKL